LDAEESSLKGLLVFYLIVLPLGWNAPTMNTIDLRRGIEVGADDPVISTIWSENLVDASLDALHFAVSLDHKSVIGEQQHGVRFFVVLGKRHADQGMHPLWRVGRPGSRRQKQQHHSQQRKKWAEPRVPNSPKKHQEAAEQFAVHLRSSRT